METIKVTRKPNDYQVRKNMRSFFGMKFAWCSELPFKQATIFHDCRETFTSCMKSRIHPKNVYAGGNNSDICIDKLRILVYMKKASKTKKEAKTYEIQADSFMENVLKAIHFFERYAGWKPTSKVYKVDMGLSFRCYIYMFEADNKWIKGPHMTSLFTLLIRCGRFNEMGNIRNYAHFAKIVRTLLDGKRKAIKEKRKRLKIKWHNPLEEKSRFLNWPCPNNSDPENLYYTSCKLGLILKNYDKLFGAKAIKSIFEYQSSTEGMTRLCRDNSTMKEIKGQLKELCEDKNIPLETRLPENPYVIRPRALF